MHTPNYLNGGLDYYTDPHGDEPIDLVNAFHTADTTVNVPDLLGITGSDADGYHLTYFVSPGWPLVNTPEFTGTLTPTGGTDWQDWQLFSTSTTSGTNIFLWNSTTGGLYLWGGVTFADNGDGTGTLSYQQYHVAKNWNVGASFTTVEASDFTGDGIPDLWTVTPAGVITAYVVSNLSTTALAHLSAKATQSLS